MCRSGYSLVEMVVVLVLLSLLVVGAATGYRSFQSSGVDARADAALVAVFDSQLQFRLQFGTFAADPGELPISSGNVTATGGASSHPEEVSVVVGEAGTLALAVRVAGERCRWKTVGTREAGGSVDRGERSDSDCQAATHLPSGEEPAAPEPLRW